MGGEQADGRRRSAPDWIQAVTTLLGIVSVLLVAVGLYITARADNATNKASLAQQALTEQGLVTERFGRAIDQLGSGKLDIRLGGIYALEQLMRDSRVDEGNIIEVLSAYVRDHTPNTEATPGSHPTKPANPPQLPTDVQAALTVLGRRPDPTHHRGIDLTNAYLAGATLNGAHLEGAVLTGANLTGANLTGAHLDGARLILTNVSDAKLGDADLTHAWLLDAVVLGTDFSNANLWGLNLTVLADGTQLAFDNLNGATLTGVKWPSDAPIPRGWVQDPQTGRMYHRTY
jgi:hypothetical protein